MEYDAGERSQDRFLRDAASARTLDDLAGLLRALRRRHARRERKPVLPYRALAARTGWSHTAVAEYLGGKTLPPTDRFDVLVGLLGASPVERGVLATARDRVDERRRTSDGRRSDDRRRSGGPSRSGEPAGVADPVVPRQLPPALRQLSGRRAEQAHLAQFAGAAALTGTAPAGLPEPGALAGSAGAAGAGPAGAVEIVAVTGPAGVGKTTLAVHCAHRVADRFPGGQLYVNLRGFDPDRPATEPAAAQRLLLDALGVPAARIPADQDGQTALYRSALAGRRLLIVLDNARDSAHVRPLLPGAGPCLVIVTSRNQLTGLVAAHGAHPVPLGLLDPAEATDLLSQRIGERRCHAEPAAVAEIVTRCAGLPLALAVVAARAATAPRMPLAALAAELRDARQRLDALAADDPNLGVRAVFSWSYQALSPPAARLFRLLGRHSGQTVSAPAAASLAGLPVDEARPLLTELVRSHLLGEHPAGRYVLHDLLRIYAAERARERESSVERDAAFGRLLDHYLHSAHGADRLLQPSRDQLTLEPTREGVIPERMTDSPAALAWFAAEHTVLLAMVDAATAAGLDRAAIQLARTLRTFLDRQGHWPALVAVQETALTAARRLADPAAQAVAHRAIARAHTRTGRHGEARRHLGSALDLYRGGDDLVGQGLTHLNLALLGERLGEHRTALEHARTAYDLYQAIGDRREQGHALNVVGWQSALLGDHRAALVSCRRALALLQEFDDRTGQANTWDSLGYAHHHLGDHAEAVRCYGRALGLFRDLGDRHAEALVLNHLGEIHQSAGDVDAARVAWRAAVRILDSLQHPDAEPIRTRLAAPVPRSPRS